MHIRLDVFDDVSIKNALLSYESLYADHDPHKYDHLFPASPRITDAEVRNLIALLSKAKAELNEARNALVSNTMMQKLSSAHLTSLDNGIETLHRLLRDNNA